LLQCRPQSYGADAVPVAIPQNLPSDKVIFSAAHFVSNGKVPDITHIVYVDLESYSQLPDQTAMRDVGRAVGRLNKLLPKRQFILVGPGRWGSRGDIKLGVPVTYSDINNTAILIEVARQKGNYLPELSFGTHFFQDLVEASIRYRDNIEADLFLLGASDRPTDHRVRCAFLAVTDELLQLCGSGQLAELDRAVVFWRAVS